MKIISTLVFVLLAFGSCGINLDPSDEVFCQIPEYNFKFYSGNIKSMQDIFPFPTKTSIMSSSPLKIIPKKILF